MKFKKKLARLGIGVASIATIVAPIASAVSCGDSDDNAIYVGIRTDELKRWEPIFAQFEKATGIKVKPQFVADQQAEYKQWGEDNMPLVTIADAGTAKVIHEMGYFQDLDLKDIMTNPKYMLDNEKLDEKYKEKEIKDSEFESAFDQEALNSDKVSENKYSTMAAVAGPHLLYLWEKNNGKDILTGDQKLRWFVPKVSGGVEEAKFTGKTHETNPLIKRGKNADTDGEAAFYKNSKEDIQDFIFDAADKTQIGLNLGAQASKFSSTNPVDHVIATGTYGQKQRIVSLGLTIKALKPEGVKFEAGAVADPGLDFSAVSQGLSGFSSKKSDVNYNNGQLDDDKWITPFDKTWDKTDPAKVNGTPVKTKVEDVNDITAAIYNGALGYFNGGDADKAAGTALGIGGAQATPVDVLATQKVFALEGAKWQQEGILGKVQPTQKEDITALSLPFMEIGVDGYALNAGASAEKAELGKKFLRFLMQPEVQFELAGNATIAVRVEGQKIQKDAYSSDKFFNAVLGGGERGTKDNFTPSYEANSLDSIYTVTKASTKNLFDLYNNKIITKDWQGVTTGTLVNVSYDVFADHLKDVSAEIKADSSI